MLTQIIKEDRTGKNQVSHISECIHHAELKEAEWNMPTKKMAITFLSYLYPDWNVDSGLMPY